MAYVQESMYKEGSAALEKVLVIRPGDSTGLARGESTRGWSDAVVRHICENSAFENHLFSEH